jgi:methyl-accepting chemotaxis protein
VFAFGGTLTKMLTKALSEYSFLCFAFSITGFLLSYAVIEKHAAKKRQKELEEDNKALNFYATLGKSAAKFCHEVSNYVGAISGNISLLHGKLDSISPEVRESVEAVQQISQDLIRIAKGFKHAVRGHFEDTKRRLSLQDLIGHLMFSQTAGVRRNRLEK